MRRSVRAPCVVVVWLELQICVCARISFSFGTLITFSFGTLLLVFSRTRVLALPMRVAI